MDPHIRLSVEHVIVGKYMMNKKLFHTKRNFFIAISFILVCILLWTIMLHIKQTFFLHLKYDEIDNIKIYSLFWYDGEQSIATLSEADMKRVYALLHQVELKGTGALNYTNIYPYNAAMYIIELTNGNVIEFAPNGSYVIINQNNCFQGDYALCIDLAELHFQLDAKYFSK